MAFSTLNRGALVAPLAVAYVIASAGGLSAQAPSTFEIAAASGYGVEDCLAEGGECGRVVADAFCEAHGRGEALKFGLSASGEAAQPQPYYITCGD